jgi:hypothetical protein
MKRRAIRTGRGKIIRWLVVALVLATAIVGYSRSPLREQGPASSSVLLQELGVDDGFAGVLFYGSDIDGNLEPCG